MPLVAALAASHAPNILLEPGSEWEEFMQLHPDFRTNIYWSQK